MMYKLVLIVTTRKLLLMQYTWNCYLLGDLGSSVIAMFQKSCFQSCHDSFNGALPLQSVSTDLHC